MTLFFSFLLIQIAIQLLLVFANVELSAFYFDVIKDRLYTSNKDSIYRRSARYVLEKVSPHANDYFFIILIL